MGSFGEKLKRERELRGVTLEEIAGATKIGTRALKALEDEHFDQLPGGIFNKGFVRAYAKFLGLDEEQMVSDFLAAQGDREAQKPDLMAKLAVQAEVQRRSEIAASGGEKSGGSNAIWVTLAILVLVTAGAAAGIRYYQMKKAAKAASQATIVTPPPQPAAPPTNSATLDASTLAGTAMNSATTDPSAATPATSTTSPASGGPTALQNTAANTALGNPTASSMPANASSTPTGSVTAATPANTAAAPKASDTKAKTAIELQIHVSKATWLSVQADGKPATTETLRDSATKTVVAQEKVVLTTGNSVDVTCNGKPLGILGTDNQRSQVRITADCKVN